MRFADFVVGVSLIFLALSVVGGFFTGSVTTGIAFGFWSSVAFTVAVVIHGIYTLDEAKKRVEALGGFKDFSEKSAHDKATTFARQHAVTLARRKKQLSAAGPYGIDQTAWDKELKKIVRSLTDKDFSLIRHEYIVRKAVDAVASSTSIDTDFDFESVKSGVDFEQFCQQKLSRIGWTTKSTPASGDQGADIVAERGSETIILQCKWYSNPVGNKAVQEAHAAKAHYGANVAAVVTNSTFTPAAEQLAKSTGVRLLHYSELEAL